VRDPGAHRVDAHEDSGGRKLTHDRQHPPHLLGGRDAVRTRPGRLTADVHDIGTLRGKRQTVLDRGGGLEVAAAVGEGVRGHVDDPHDEAPLPHR
jgi:hypothetical protein